MKICLLEPFYTGSHAAWANEYAKHSRHDVELLTLSGRHWKWRMHGGAISLAKKYLEKTVQADLLLATDMLDLTTFLALTRHRTSAIATAVYFHENQLTYPWSPDDADTKYSRDAHYAFINYSSALAADINLFNSDYHRTTFLEHLPGFLNSFPDQNELLTINDIKQKSATLPLGLELSKLDRYRPGNANAKNAAPLILWNHRWEYDKNPEDFFKALFLLKEEGYEFRLVILGESYRKHPPVFDEAQKRLGDRIVHFGYTENFSEYAEWLWKADILPVTSHHDFFGASVVQAIYCDCTPLLPRRLAYPEHIPGPLHDLYLYDDFDELLVKLRQELKSTRKSNQELAKRIAAYDWGHMAQLYDDLMETLL